MTRYYYLDTSVAVHILFGQSDAAAQWFDDTADDPDAVIFSSRLLRTELTRVLRREGLELSRRDAIIDYLEVMPMSDAVLTEAEAIVPHLKTLDSIHMASVIRGGFDAAVVTHDATLRAVAEQIGYSTLDPVGG